jgi:hypothetical protein
MKINNYDLNRLYPIKVEDEIAGFLPGHLPNGEQVLMGAIDLTLLLGLFFSSDGQLLRHEFFPVPFNPDPKLPPVKQRVGQAYVLQDAKRRWMVELGMKLGEIRVRHFAFPQWRIGIAEWPLSEWKEVASLMEKGLPLESEFQINWKERGCWVLHWGQEFWMSAEGEVDAT